MHPALHIDAIKTLPPSFRRLVAAACNKNCSVDDVNRLRVCLATQNLPRRHQIAFLPAFFVHLDLERLPSPETNEISGSSMDDILRAVLSINSVTHLEIPSGAGVFLWPRVWAWNQCIGTNWDRLDNPPERFRFGATIVRFATQFNLDDNTWHLISETPGFRAFVAETWKHAHEAGSVKDFEDVGAFIPEIGAKDPAHLSEFIDGAGGTVDDLASLLVAYTNSLANHTSASERMTHDTARLFNFLSAADNYRGNDADLHATPLSLLCQAFLRDGGLDALLSVLEMLVQCKVTYGPGLTFGTSFLTRVLVSVAGHVWLEAKLPRILQFLVTSATQAGSSDSFYQQAQWIVTWAIPMALVYWGTVAEMQFALKQVESAVSVEAFQSCLLFKDWEALVEIAEKRIAVLADQDFEEPRKCCDNLACNLISSKESFKRCARCKAFYYCSASCQKNDWQAGGHRAACRSYKSMTLNEDRSHLTVRDRDYLRALMHRDYTSNTETIYADQVKLMAAKPTSQALTVFDYSLVPMQITVHSATDSPLGSELMRGSEYSDLVARAVTSGGTLQLHLVKIFQAMQVRQWVALLRCADSSLYDGLKSLTVADLYEKDGDITERFALVLDEALKTVHS
ncbi:hypothetical protein R3P38DRAFT_3546874 [Favolaschia claudopus]|uniref:phytol kinase n=1 Tax=Favolaschia claudopus TaxID=2862362 RepID=A0AAW0DYC7_9AGAR